MLNGEKIISRPLRWAMVGGGRLSQVGYKHRTGALRDNTAFRLTAGAFDIDKSPCGGKRKSYRRDVRFFRQSNAASNACHD